MAAMRIRALRLTFVGLAAGCLLGGCSSGSAQRTAYETMQNVGQQDCRRNPSLECPKRGSYDDYQRQRRDLESK
jgi:hypothetical protein